jgi:NADH-quinone oxidoreductase subunit D
MTATGTSDTGRLGHADTDEGGQELRPRSELTAKEIMREVGAVLRMSEADAARLGEMSADDPIGQVLDADDEQTMLINMGPQHPSTHGVLRLMLELQGETVLRCKPIIGYLHTGMEKTGEQLTYLQGGTNVTRMDYASPLNNELVFSMATEKLLGIDDDIPERAVWMRMLLSELNRMSSHLLFMATNGMDLGAVSMMLYGWREREEVLRFFQKVTGLRMNHNFIRPGGLAADLPAGWRDDVLRLLELIPPRLDEYDTLMTGQPIWRERLQGVGVITPAEALALGATGPILRSTGVEWDLRRDQPYLRYDEVDFDVVVGSYGDSFDRYAIRLNEIRESMRIVRQVLDRMPAGDYRIQDKKITPPPRARIDESMEALIHHFKLFTEGFKVPAGETYVAIESPRGEIGCYLVSDGTGKPARLHIRGPSFYNLQSMEAMVPGTLMADAVAIISSVDPVMGEVDR